jgi:hypothetical protein
MCVCVCVRVCSNVCVCVYVYMYMCMCTRLSDHKGEQGATWSQVASKRLMDADRLVVAQEADYYCVRGKLHPREASPKNDVLLGGPSRLGLARVFPAVGRGN